jgi:dienelactone hydrolase
LYASGDGGWFGAAVGMFRELATTGCPVVGISSKAFLKIDRPSKKLVDPRQLAGEYALVIGQARVALGLPSDTPVLLTGWSRGASFAVLAAGELRRTDRVVGVLAIGLPRGEDLTIDGPDDETDDGPTDDVVKRWPFDPYQQIVRLAPVPVAIIQATHDNYLPAARAQQLFGPDTDDRRFYTVDARNHRFSGSKPGLNRSLLDAVSWIRSRFAASSTLAPPSCL